MLNFKQFSGTLSRKEKAMDETLTLIEKAAQGDDLALIALGMEKPNVSESKETTPG